MSFDLESLERAKQFRLLEAELNRLSYNKVMIGQLLVHPFYFLFRDKYQPEKGKKIKQILKAFLVSITSFGSEFKTAKSVFYYRSADRHHLDEIWFSVKKTFKAEDIFVFGGTAETDMSRKQVHKVSFIKILKLQWWYLTHVSRIKTLLRKSALFGQHVDSLLLDLNYQLICSLFWDGFFKSSPNIKLLVGDFDRGHESSVIFASSKKYNLPSVVIQHGAVSPPYSFTPLIADKVFLWGEMQARQFVEMGAAVDDLVVTGTPIIKRVNRSFDRRNAILQKHGLDPNRKNIILGITPVKPEYNKTLIEVFATLSSDLKGKFNFIIKLHPVHKEDDFAWIADKFDISVFGKSLVQEEYFNICDVLLAHSTGLANESYYYGIHVGILDILNMSPGNGIELNKFVGVPLLKNYKEIETFILESTMKENKVKNSDLIYAGIGEEAGDTIKQELLKYACL